MMASRTGSVVVGVLGLGLTVLGGLWFLQGAGVVHMRPVLCVANCKPVTKSVGWMIAGSIAIVAGIAVARIGARRLGSGG